MSSLLVPSPQSEAVTHEMEELSLQPTQSLPPLSERKNGEDTPAVQAFHGALGRVMQCNLATVLDQQNIYIFSFSLSKN